MTQHGHLYVGIFFVVVTLISTLAIYFNELHRHRNNRWKVLLFACRPLVFCVVFYSLSVISLFVYASEEGEFDKRVFGYYLELVCAADEQPSN